MNSQASATAKAVANKEVEKAMESDRTPRGKRGPYKLYSPSLRPEIAKYACMQGAAAAAAARWYSNKLNEHISKSTVKTMKKQYEDELRKQQRTDDGEDLQVLLTKRQGRKLLLGEKLDSMVQLSGADPGFEKGEDTPKQSVENSKINDIHYLLNYVRSNV